MFAKCLQSGFDFSETEYELKLEHLVYNLALIIISLTLILLSLFRLLQENYLQSLVDFAFFFLSIFSLYYIRKDKYTAKKIVPSIIFLFLLLISFSYINTDTQIGASWFMVLIVLSYYTGNLRAGILITLSSLLFIIVLEQLSNEETSFIMFFNILTPMLLVSGFLLIYEKKIRIIQTLLKTKNISLSNKITQKTEDELALIKHNKELADVVYKSKIELYIIDFESDKFLYTNKGASDALLYSQAELLEMSLYDINPSLTVEHISHLKSLAATAENIMHLSNHQRKDGTSYGVQSFIHEVTYKQKAAYVIYDINLTDLNIAQNQLLEQKEELLKQAHHDTLTGLPNRALFNDRLEQAMIKSNRSGKEFAILFIDLDKFKEINDTYGHNIGDLVLCEVAQRFQNVLRESDTISRFGGDEFVCIIEQIDSSQTASFLAQKLINKIKEPMIVHENTLELTCSIGISLYKEDTQDTTDLLAYADNAMYKAKDLGKDTYQFYSPVGNKSQIS